MNNSVKFKPDFLNIKGSHPCTGRYQNAPGRLSRCEFELFPWLPSVSLPVEQDIPDFIIYRGSVSSL